MGVNIPAVKAMLTKAARCRQCGRDASRQNPAHRTCDGCGAGVSPVIGRLFGVPVTAAAFAMLDPELQHQCYNLMNTSIDPDVTYVLKDLFGFAIKKPTDFTGAN